MAKPKIRRLLALLTAATMGACAVYSLSRTTYEDAVLAFGVTPTQYDADMAEIAVRVLERVPIGSAVVAVSRTLVEWGFEETSGDVWRGRRFRVFRGERGTSVRAFEPYTDPPWDLSRFVCDTPGINVYFQFEDAQLSGVRASAARGCI